MSVQIETRPSAAREDEWQPRPELLQAMQNIASIAEGDDTAVITDRAITFNNLAPRTSILASEVDLVTIDGLRISERIDIRTPLPDVFSELTDAQITLANTMATTGAIVRDPDEDGAVLVSSLPVFEVDTTALADLYTGVVANAALVQLFGPIAAAQYLNEARDDEPFHDDIPGWGSPSY